MTDNYNQSAVTQVPAEVSSNGEQDILNRFRSFDELQDRVRNLPFSEFAGRYAPNNYEAAERIYAQVSKQLYEQSRFNESIYDKRIEPQDPDTYAHFDTNTLSGKVLDAIFGDTSDKSMSDSFIKSLIVSNAINSTASISNAYHDFINAFGANSGRYNTTPEEEQERQRTRQLIEDTAKRMPYGVSPETKDAMVEIKVKQDKIKA